MAERPTGGPKRARPPARASRSAPPRRGAGSPERGRSGSYEGRPPPPKMPRKWGSVARRGGRVVKGEEWRDAPEGEERPTPARRPDSPPDRDRQSRAPAPRRPARRPSDETRRAKAHPGTDVHPAKEQGRREERARDKPLRTAESGRDQRRRSPRAERLPPEVAREVQRAGGRRGDVLADRLAHAAEAYA